MNLYHYTNDGGFEGIILNNTFRLVLSTQSNDEKDTIEIYDLIKNNKDKFHKENDKYYNMMIDELLNSFNKLEERVKKNDVNDKFAKPFVMCFTPKRDNKGMWDGYKANKGYCIGIDEKLLENYMSTSTFKKEKCKKARTSFKSGVVYDEDKQINIIKKTIDDEYNKFLNNKNEELSKEVPSLIIPWNLKINLVEDTGEKYTCETKPKYTQIALKKKFIDLVYSIYKDLLLVAPLLKNPYWESENETRLVFLRMLKDAKLEDIKEEEIRGEKKYCFYIKIDKSIINEIIIAPLNEKSVEEVKAELIKAGYDINKVDVKYSSGKGVLRDN